MNIRKCRLYIQKIIEFAAKYREKDTVVLMFHQVYSGKREFEPYSISIDNYMEFLIMLMRQGCNFIDLKRIRTNSKSKNVLITFDDAYADVFHNVFEFMKAKKLPFTVFQTIDHIGKDNYLTTEMINEMLQYDKITLGAHSVSHKSQYELNEQSSDWEAQESKRTLEAMFGQNIFAYAYPYGSYNHIKRLNVESVKKAQYAMAFSTLKAGTSVSEMQGKFLIPRINVNDNNYKEIMAKYII